LITFNILPIKRSIFSATDPDYPGIIAALVLVSSLWQLVICLGQSVNEEAGEIFPVFTFLVPVPWFKPS